MKCWLYLAKLPPPSSQTPAPTKACLKIMKAKCCMWVLLGVVALLTTCNLQIRTTFVNLQYFLCFVLLKHDMLNIYIPVSIMSVIYVEAVFEVGLVGGGGGSTSDNMQFVDQKHLCQFATFLMFCSLKTLYVKPTIVVIKSLPLMTMLMLANWVFEDSRRGRIRIPMQRRWMSNRFVSNYQIFV